MFKFSSSVSKELSEEDKSLLKDDGVYLPSVGHKRKRRHLQSTEGSSDGKKLKNDHLESRWQEVKQYLDPNPHLKGVDLRRYAPKVLCIT